jgi:hypothetical protein
VPYLKDGKMELKSAEASAQVYTMECLYNQITGLIYICGDRKDPLYRETSFSTICEDLNSPGSPDLDYGLDICPVLMDTSIKDGWCVFVVGAALSCSLTPCDVADLFYHSMKKWNYIIGCNSTTGCNDADRKVLYETYLHKTYGKSICTVSSLISEMKEGKGLLVNEPEHVWLIYKISLIDDGHISQYQYFDTDDPTNCSWNHIRSYNGDFFTPPSGNTIK